MRKVLLFFREWWVYRNARFFVKRYKVKELKFKSETPGITGEITESMYVGIHEGKLVFFDDHKHAVAWTFLSMMIVIHKLKRQYKGSEYEFSAEIVSERRWMDSILKGDE